MIKRNHMFVLAFLGLLKLVFSVFGISFISSPFYDTLINGISSLCVLSGILMNFQKGTDTKTKDLRTEEERDEPKEK